MRMILMMIWLLATVCARADDWPQFNGPGQGGVSGEIGLAREWTVGQPRTLWTVNLNRGYGGAAIRDGEVFVLDRVAEEKDVLLCLDLETGKVKWEQAIPRKGSIPYPGSRTVPTVDAEHVYALTGFGQLVCVSRTTHEPVWSHHLLKEFPVTNRVSGAQSQAPRWGFTQNPVLYNDTLIASPMSESAGLVAYDRTTGKERWRSGYVGLKIFAHATPRLVNLCGVNQFVVQANLHGGKNPPALITGIDAESGKLLWQFATWRPYNIPVPMPVPVGQDRLLFAGGYRVGAFMVQWTKNSDKWTHEYIWKDNQDCAPHLHTPVFYKGYIYANSFDKFHNSENNGLVCMDLGGKLKWKSGPNDVFDSGGLLIADDMIYILHGQTGELSLVAADPTGYSLRSRKKVLNATDGEAWAPLAISNEKLIVRDLTQMKCLDVKLR
jgi:outer membrane protein assembly factor BamB